MKNKKAVATVAICCLACLLATNVGRASISQLNITTYPENSYFVKLIVQGDAKNTYATALAADWISGAALPSNTPDPFVSFCMDIKLAFVPSGAYWNSGGFADATLTAQSPGVPQRLTDSLYRAANLYQTYSGGIMPTNGNWASATTTQKEEGAALQLAIWEVLYQPAADGYNVLTGGSDGFQVTNILDTAVTTMANHMLQDNSGAAAAVNLNLTTTFWNAVVGPTDSTSSSNQDLIGPVPEPTTLIAGALLLLPFGASTLRILRRGRAA